MATPSDEPAHEILSPAQWLAVEERLRLTSRQLAIVRFVLDDETEIQISRALDMSPHTVHEHLKRLYRRLRVHGRASLVVRVMAAVHDDADGRHGDDHAS